MIGNVCEWCGDWYGDYGHEDLMNPNGPDYGTNRVFRGGGWIGGARFCRSARRAGIAPGYRSHLLGFRVALAPSH